MKRRAAKDPAATRLRRLKAVHAIRRQMGLDDDVYRDLVQRVTRGAGFDGWRSAGDCDPAQLAAILREFQKLQGKPAEQAVAARVWAAKPKGDLSPQVAKIEALLADAGREWAYGHALAKRICKVNRIEWCNRFELQKLIAALEYDAKRRARRAAGE
ncbi:regulatory protein GemA [Luteimonas terricola]|uniref:GemA protein n=1 Tax=Luteimonas terricola TaxID=645597 RepID=A0ABQ2EEZ4_9GAMM|nr:regulatory protein GemA [Luteimonas terricola]GGK08864.1 GemA protein [Luteimonas terricola]